MAPSLPIASFPAESLALIEKRQARRTHLHLLHRRLYAFPPAWTDAPADSGTLSEIPKLVIGVWGFCGDMEKAKVRFRMNPTRSIVHKPGAGCRADSGADPAQGVMTRRTSRFCQDPGVGKTLGKESERSRLSAHRE